MKDTIKTIAKMCFVSALWFVVVIAISFTAIGLIDGSGLLSEASASLRAGLAMGIALLVASLTAAAVWIKLRSTATSSKSEQQPLESGSGFLPAQETV